jgi:hypothetical protein
MLEKPALRTLLLGGLVVGSLDAAYAIAFWVPRGSTPGRIFQSIAAGWFGRATYEGGLRTILIGAATHYFIATMIVAVYALAASRIRVLLDRPLFWGSIYGLGVYAVMNYVVIPLSAAGGKPNRFIPWIVCSIVVHAFLIGLPSALFARRALLGNRLPPGAAEA